jgi:predicted dehydrogenase
MTVAEAQQMIDECKNAGVALSVNFPRRMMNLSRTPKKLIEAGVIGEIIYITIDERGFKPESYWTDGWGARVKTDWRPKLDQAGGGILIMNAIHTIDALRYITGLEAVTISAQMDTFVSDVEVEDTVAAVIRCDNGAIWNVQSASSLVGNDNAGTVIHGRLGQIQLRSPLRVYTTRTDTDFTPNEFNEVEVPRGKLTYVPYLTETCGAILAGREVPIPGI